MAEEKTIAIAPGVQANVFDLTPDEAETFEAEFPQLVERQTRYTLSTINKRVGLGKDGPVTSHAIADLYYKHKDDILLAAMVSKAMITPRPGSFGGLDARSGFGWRLIRMPDVCPAAQGDVTSGSNAEKWDADYSTAGWVGFLHNGAIGAAYTSTSLLSIRKQFCIIIIGVEDYDQTPRAAMVQFNRNGKEQNVDIIEPQLRGADLPLAELRKPELLLPTDLFNSQMHVTQTGGGSLHPLGVTFCRAEFLKKVPYASGDQISTTPN